MQFVALGVPRRQSAFRKTCKGPSLGANRRHGLSVRELEDSPVEAEPQGKDQLNDIMLLGLRILQGCNSGVGKFRRAIIMSTWRTGFEMTDQRKNMETVPLACQSPVGAGHSEMHTPEVQFQMGI